MPTQRETVREQRAALVGRAKERGIDLIDLMRESRDPRVLSDGIMRLLNGAAPLPGRFALQVDDPPLGPFDGSNLVFQLTAPVAGQNLVVIETIQSTGTMTQLAKTTSSAPTIGTFFFDGTANLTVGRAPSAGDGLIAIYITRR